MPAPGQLLDWLTEIGNTTDLPIAEHTTDTHGQTLLTFALVGLRLSPRIARFTQQRL